MKPTPATATAIPRLAILIASLSSSHPLLAADPTPASEPAAPKDHVLFVGTDIEIKQGDRYYPVIGATENSFLIERGQGVQAVGNIRDVKLQVKRGVKLSNRSAELANVRMESIDRAAGDARFEAMKASMQMDNVSADGMDLLQGAVTAANSVGVFYDPNSPNNVRGAAETAAAIQANKAAAIDRLGNGAAGLMSQSAAANTLANEGLVPRRPTEVELSFDVSSPEPLDHAYVVVIANYESPVASVRQVSTQHLDRVDRKPHRVRLTLGTSVADMVFKDYIVALYANGQEIATNLSAKRVELTADDAYKFYLIEYLTANAKATKGPTPMLMLPRATFRRQIGNAEVNRLIYATVEKSGAVTRLAVDEAGAEKIPAAIETAMQNVRFMPALRDGTPVDGRMTLTLADLLD
jgi:hypothetical protein